MRYTATRPMKTSTLLATFAALVVLPVAAAADIPPLPGEAEAFRRDLIRDRKSVV